MIKTRSGILFYIITIGALVGLIFFVLHAGKQLETSIGSTLTANPMPKQALQQNAHSALSHPLAVFIMQITIIIIASRLCAYLFQKIGQPAVMGETIAGILLGPSLMSAALPGFSQFIFPAASLGNLQMLSQIGLILFMFVIGMELDLNVLKKKAGAAIMISHASIVIPYGLGVSLAYFIYQKYAPPHIPFYAFSLFMGIAMSITAFPVLARIIRERNWQKTRLGTLAITCAAADDITAWCLLAIVVAIAKAGSLSAAMYTILFALIYVLAMFFIIKPFLSKLLSRKTEDKNIHRSTLALVFVVLLLSAYCAEVIGIHALFGAFLAGVVMPQNWNFRNNLIHKIEDVALVLLLPLFFVFTGLRTQVGLLNTPELGITCLLIILIAVLGKLGGSAFTARFTGETPRNSLAIGALMNTRGLVELVVLNIGYDLGILTPEMFTMMVLMAIVTTLMTTPILNWLKVTGD
ncbi:cation:proton antiporter domain-containing protein [Taibaiella soli]|uniref:Cation/H+ exchanger transmembrane domain-containing protein n=1 Tax=Taibaiella soli TaxID=1649169 RepID=A0A2W2B9G2_9BACT|nr:cation:proton antiporter [Taibaiella soli]PZF72547.1 hypothetical protein DN068_11830 [Taibaiella soli]